ncbi:MAG: hypothetical protein ACPG8V_01140 [Alphaproteobacteria bacterium]
MKTVSSIFPYLTTLFAVLLSNNSSFGGNIYLDLAIPVIYYWVIVRPESMWFSYLFILGIIADVLSNITLGIHSIAYLLIWVMVIYFNRQKVMDNMVGINVVNFIVISVLYSFYGLCAYLKDSLQIGALVWGVATLFIISVILNGMHYFRRIR